MSAATEGRWGSGGLCESCVEAIRALAQCPAVVRSNWSCPTCGEQEFYKEADEPVAEGPWPSLVRVAFIAAVVVAWLLTGGVK